MVRSGGVALISLYFFRVFSFLFLFVSCLFSFLSSAFLGQ
uniref:Uncharacterized protein n=1 Tax=Arundo donax TaxID=35708 RepID=A0A0A9BGD6_ARUDO